MLPIVSPDPTKNLCIFYSLRMYSLHVLQTMNVQQQAKMSITAHNREPILKVNIDISQPVWVIPPHPFFLQSLNFQIAQCLPYGFQIFFFNIHAYIFKKA